MFGPKEGEEDLVEEECFWEFCLLLLGPSFDDEFLLTLGDVEPVELLLDRSGKGHKLLLYPVPQLLLLLKLQKDLELCLSYTPSFKYFPSLELSFFKFLLVESLWWLLTHGGGNGGCGADWPFGIKGAFFFLLTSVGRILPSEKNSSAGKDSSSKLSVTQKSKSLLELTSEGFDPKGCCSTGITSDWEKSCENEILGLMEETPQFSEQSSSAIFSFKTFWGNFKGNSPQTQKPKMTKPHTRIWFFCWDKGQ